MRFMHPADLAGREGIQPHVSRSCTGRILISVFTCWLVCTGLVEAGLGPQNVLIVVNDASTNSQALGQYYQEARGIPESQVVHVLTSVGPELSATAFTNEVWQPIQSHIDSYGLSNQVRAILYSMDLPSRIVQMNAVNSSTAMAFYGLKTYPGSPVCLIANGSANPYFAAEESFDVRQGMGGAGEFLSSMLTADSLEQAQAVVDRAILADGVCPTGTVYYLHSTDLARNVRWPQHEEVDVLTRLTGCPLTGRIEDGNTLTGRSDVAGCMIGRTRIPGEDLASNTFVLGALSDHLTSFGGRLFDSGGQMSVLKWLEAGCAGSYGTVVEPCNFIEKFPDARLHFWYGRGFSMAEAYFMSVKNPYMGIVVGDPLCAPYALSPAVVIGGLTNGQVVAESVELTVTGLAHSVMQPVAQLDLFLDDVYWMTLPHVGVTAGDRCRVVVNGSVRTYTADAGDGLADLAAGLADALNKPPNLGVTATAVRDRIELRQDELGQPGATISYHAPPSATTDTASVVTVGTNFIESIYPARARITLNGNPAAGDSIHTIVQRLDGVRVTNEVEAVEGDNSQTLLEALRDRMNGDPGLAVPSGCTARYVRSIDPSQAEMFLVSRTNGWASYNLQLTYDVVSGESGLMGPNYDGPFASNSDVMRARGMIYVTLGKDSLVHTQQMDATSFADGPHRLKAVAYDGTAVRVQGSEEITFTVDNLAIGCSLQRPMTNFWYAYDQDVQVVPKIVDALGAVTSVVYFVEGKIAGEQVAGPFEFVFNTADYGWGSVGVQVRVRTDAGEEVLSDRVAVDVLDPRDQDGDGLPDGWERREFGGTNDVIATGDADEDNVSNLDEYLSGTDPNDDADFLRCIEFRIPFSSPVPEVQFTSNPTRRYGMQYLASNLSRTNRWLPENPPLFYGDPTNTVWLDVGSSADTNDPVRIYRVRVLAP